MRAAAASEFAGVGGRRHQNILMNFEALRLSAMSSPDGPQGHKRKREGKDAGSRKVHRFKNLDPALISKIKAAAAAPPAESASAQPKPNAGNGHVEVPGKFKNLDGAPAQGRSNGKPSDPLAVRRNALQQVRQKLPIWPQASTIRDSLSKVDVLVLAGETGSGKSTQVPQFLLSSPWCSGRVAVTQPRRVAAISLARRVADEMGSQLGKSSPLSKVGYSVRFDDNVSGGNKIKFLTEGMLLQEMLRDPGLTEYSCVVVDEVHERSVNVDLILGFLRGLVCGTGEGIKKRKGKPLKVVVMSATADTEALKHFFLQGYQEASSKTFIPAETAVDASGDKSARTKVANSAGKKGNRATKATGVDGADRTNQDGKDEIDGRVSTCLVEGRQYPVQTYYLSEPTRDFSEAALLRIFEIHRKEPMPGDILVFLTGQEVVTELQRSVEEYMPSIITPESGLPNMLVLPLFAALPQAAQQLIFAPAPPNTRKVILATNIAETSITVPGVRFVVDCGKAKIKQYRNRLGLDSLLVKAISRSSAVQRQGRAGREAAGKCWRLYTKKDFEILDKDTVPEILRCDLSAAVLTMKARGIDDVLGFPLLTPPTREAMERALLQLLDLNTLNPDDGAISNIGRQVARLPLTPALGRVVIAAASSDVDCLLYVIDIVACFSVENIFIEIKDEDMKDDAREARNRLSRRQGDHLTLLAAVQSYASEKTDRKKWAKQHLVSHRAMQSVMDVRKQLRAQCQQAKLLTAEALANADDIPAVSEDVGNIILRCFLRGFSSNVARLMPDGSYRTFFGNQNVAIHPSSVLFGKKLEAIIYNEFVYTNRTYARGVSAIQLNWLDDVF
ncbi:hypothetical protein MBLNU459_g2683t1 [Dothideomycetes sp. NU459]